MSALGPRVHRLAASIVERRTAIPRGRAMLVGVSGIDASGKGFVASKLAAELEEAGARTATINVDGWLNLPKVRFGTSDPGRHFYENALRLDEMFERLIIPLRRDRSVCVTADFAEETAPTFSKHQYRFENIDVILLEGIFLFKKGYRDLFDFAIWIEAPFETALKRAILRSQEGLSREETIEAYETIYFPAQRIHFEIDDPSSSADISFDNG
jgi:uridine kinase